MIVARFCKAGGTPIVARGSCRLDRYGPDPEKKNENKGWFPIESFNFGFEDKSKKKEGKKSKTTPDPNSSGKNSGTGTTPEESDDGDFGTIKIKKQVDATSVSLMMLVMEERLTGLGKREKTPIEVDIHVISTVEFLKYESSTYTSLMIHLEAVSVLGWSIDGSGDLRPGENVTLKYDRAAMIYNEVTSVPGDKGKTLINIQKFGPKGWDQNNSETFDEFKKGEFRWIPADWEEYLPKF